MSSKPIRLVALAIAAVAVGFAVGARGLLSVPAQGGPMRVLLDGQTLAMRDVGSLHWFLERGIVQGLSPTSTHGEGLVLRLRPAAGVAIPSGSFAARFVRFNDAGEVIEIDGVGEAPTSQACHTYWIQDTGDPEWWIVVCVGTCPPASSSCLLMFDAGTGTLSCGCP